MVVVVEWEFVEVVVEGKEGAELCWVVVLVAEAWLVVAAIRPHGEQTDWVVAGQSVVKREEDEWTFPMEGGLAEDF